MYVEGIKCTRVGTGRAKALLPTGLGKSYAASLHFNLRSWHKTKNEIAKRIRSDFHIIDEARIFEKIANCEICQLCTRTPDRKHTYALNKLPSLPREAIAFDIAGNLTTCQSGEFKYIYVAID